VANNASAEALTTDFNVSPTSTGFIGKFSSSTNATYVYIAIRRGPMKVPTVGTSVFAPVSQTSAKPGTITTNFPVDLTIGSVPAYGPGEWTDRLRGSTTTTYRTLYSPTTAAEVSGSGQGYGFDNNVAIINNYIDAGFSSLWWNFRRAPSFFDEVCYTGNGAGNNAITQNLGVAPELLIIKNRSSSGSGDWYTFHTFTSSNFKKQLLSTTDAQTNYTYGSFLDAQPTSTTFTVNSGAGCNASGTTYVSYLFASCAGVSKVGSYTGNGTTQTINCGFTGGARFVLIKRTDDTGGWYVWDSARGIIPSNDPYLLINSTAAEVTGTDYVDTTAVGFDITSTAPAAINASGGTFIFLAIA
jgi:hypothetical protein